MSNGDGGKPAAWYLACVATFMIPAGIQMVLLPYLLAIELNQPAERFGITQMIGQLPILVFLLFGGWLADRVDPRRLLMVIQAAAIGMPLLLAVAIWRGQLSEGLLMLYALAWGLSTAFAMPARDGLLKRVAGSNVQRMVTLAMGMQFAAMMIGQGLGGRAAHWGSIGILLVQCLVLASGIYATSRLPPGAAQLADANAGPARDSLWREFASGLALIFSDPPMRATLLLTLGMGVFFIGGAYVVLMPLTIRDLYSGGAQDLATGYIAFGIGSLVSIVVLTKRGGIAAPGRALAIALLLGSCVLAWLAAAPPKWLFYVCILVWGMCGGVAMAMSRTILQERAPATHQARVMAALALATLGGGPLGSLIMGLAVGAVGARLAVLLPVLCVALMTAAVLGTHSIWGLRSRSM